MTNHVNWCVSKTGIHESSKVLNLARDGYGLERNALVLAVPEQIGRGMRQLIPGDIERTDETMNENDGKIVVHAC